MDYITMASMAVVVVVVVIIVSNVWQCVEVDRYRVIRQPFHGDGEVGCLDVTDYLLADPFTSLLLCSVLHTTTLIHSFEGPIPSTLDWTATWKLLSKRNNRQITVAIVMDDCHQPTHTERRSTRPASGGARARRRPRVTGGCEAVRGGLHDLSAFECVGQ